MSLNREQLRDEVRLNIKRPATGLSDASLNRYINWAQDEVSDRFTFEEMRRAFVGETVEGERFYGYPARMKDIYTLVLEDTEDSRKLVYYNARSFDRDAPYPEGLDGTPLWYIDYGTNFELYKVPDDAYSLILRCSVYPEELDDDDTESGLVRKDQLIIAFATAAGFRAIAEEEKVLFWEGQAARMLDRAKETDHSGEDWVPIARGFSTSRVVLDHTNPWVGR